MVSVQELSWVILYQLLLAARAASPIKSPMPPSTWLLNTVGPMAFNYVRRRYRRKLGNALYKRARRSFSGKSRNLRGTRRRRIASKPVKRNWSRAMGVTAAPSARSSFKRTKYYTGLGERPGARGSRRHRLEELNTSYLDKDLNAVPMVSAAYSDTDTRMDVRSGRLCNVRGVKFRCWFNLKNQLESSTKYDHPLQIRWALLNPRDQTTGTVLDVTIGNNFFQSDQPTSDDAADFPTTGNCFKYQNRKINQRKYGVVQEGTFILNNNVASNNGRMALESKKMISLYIPVNRQMKWPNNGTATADKYPSTNLYFAFWYTELGDTKTAATYPTANDAPFDFMSEAVTYFENAKVMM